MIKGIHYNGHVLRTVEIDGNPHASMKDILMSVIPDSWNDYLQVINSSDDLVYDLNIKCVEDTWMIPVIEVSRWLFSFSTRNMKGPLYERFRVYRRDMEKVMRVAWALPVDDIVISTSHEDPFPEPGQWDAWDIHSIFAGFDIPEDELVGVADEEEMYGPLPYLEHLCSSSNCGPRGTMICEMIDYISDLPNSRVIYDYINCELTHYVPEPTKNLDVYLDEINSYIGTTLTKFVGEL